MGFNEWRTPEAIDGALGPVGFVRGVAPDRSPCWEHRTVPTVYFERPFVSGGDVYVQWTSRVEPSQYGGVNQLATAEDRRLAAGLALVAGTAIAETFEAAQKAEPKTEEMPPLQVAAQQLRQMGGVCKSRGCGQRAYLHGYCRACSHDEL